ncbi:MAG: serine protease [Thermomonas sp.]
MKTRILAAIIAASLFVPAAQATIIPVNQDGAGVGLNDPTPRAPEGGNPGTTVGQQRQIVYQFAADLWGSVLTTDIDVKVSASFAALSCNASSATLGSAGAWWLDWNFPNAEFADTIYHAALANQIAGENLNAAEPEYEDPDNVEIHSQFNANLGQSNCLAGSGWYYGLDGNTPAGQISFLDVVLHEIGHGLGFSGFVGYSDGVLGERVGVPGAADIYTHYAYDNVTGARFTDPAMTDALRTVALKTPGQTSWDGDAGKAQAPLALGPVVAIQITGSLTANYPAFGTASFGPAATSTNFNGNLVIVNDGVGDGADACEPLPAGSLTGKVAFINRGGATCSSATPSIGFEGKAKNAQNAGAIAVIIGNVASSGTPGTAPGMADDPNFTVTIPTLSLNLNDANAIRAQATGMHAGFGTVAGSLAGADSGNRPLLYTPTTVANGSTFSHYDISLTPNALMEPFINDDLAGNFRTDLTLAVFQDEGWVLKSGNARIGQAGCDTWVPLYTNPGLMAGANVIANDRLCSASGSLSTRAACLKAVAATLKAQGLITSTQERKINTCAMVH